ncbi:MAG: hypothetical protein C5B49_09455 [Bdellovibrio sp.]|nr:MAG: hypothetical protein C5B49_09455 [Bdellovibrio sp.]
MTKNTTTQWMVGLTVAGPLLILAACSGAGSGSTSDGSCTTTLRTLFSNNNFITCVNCHQGSGSSSQTNLDMTSADTAYNGLLATVQSPSNPSQCANVKRVVPQHPELSYLMGILFADYNSSNFGGVSNCQPPYASHSQSLNLPPNAEADIKAWINCGANQ